MPDRNAPDHCCPQAMGHKFDDREGTNTVMCKRPGCDVAFHSHREDPFECEGGNLAPDSKYCLYKDPQIIGRAVELRDEGFAFGIIADMMIVSRRTVENALAHHAAEVAAMRAQQGEEEV